jgi:hypothetical protein
MEEEVARVMGNWRNFKERFLSEVWSPKGKPETPGHFG